MSFYSFQIYECGVQYNRADLFWSCRDKFNYQRLYYILEGEAYFFDRGNEYLVSEGNVYIFPSNLEFVMKQYSKERMRLLYFDFYTVPPIVSDRIFGLRAESDPVAMGILSSMLELFSELEPTRIGFPQGDPDPKKRLLCSLFDCLLMRLSNNFGIEYKIDPVIRESVVYMSENFTKELHVEDLAKRAHLCTDHYTRLFRENMNSTPYQYLMNLRLNRALVLKDQGVSGEQLLEMTGFSTLDSLARAIRRTKAKSQSRFCPE